MRVLVCGGRDFYDYGLVYQTLKDIPITTIIEGGAKGADALANRYGVEENIDVVTFQAPWKLYGKRAGYIRNKQMLDEGKPELVVAFPGGKGTANMVELAKEARVPVRQIVKGMFDD